MTATQVTLRETIERALTKARTEYVRAAEAQGDDPGPTTESWAEFEALAEALQEAPEPAQPDALVGKWFHSFQKADEDDCQIVRWQGEIVATPAPGIYLVQTYDWFVGTPHSTLLVPLDQMLDEGWVFYHDNEDMRDCYEHRIGKSAGSTWHHEHHTPSLTR